MYDLSPWDFSAKYLLELRIVEYFLKIILFVKKNIIYSLLCILTWNMKIYLVLKMWKSSLENVTIHCWKCENVLLKMWKSTIEMWKSTIEMWKSTVESMKNVLLKMWKSLKMYCWKYDVKIYCWKYDVKIYFWKCDNLLLKMWKSTLPTLSP